MRPEMADITISKSHSLEISEATQQTFPGPD